MSSPVDRDVIFDMMQQRVADMDHLIQPVIDSLFEQVKLLGQRAQQMPIVAGAPLRTSRRELIQKAIEDEMRGYEQDGAAGRRFVLEVIEDYIHQEWEAFDAVVPGPLGRLTPEEASMENLLRKHWEVWKGKVVYANRLQAFNDFDGRDTYEFDPPIAVRIDDGRQCDVFRFHEDWLDTEYDCSPIDPDDPRLEGLRTMTVDGPSVERKNPDVISFESCAIVYPEQTA